MNMKTHTIWMHTLLYHTTGNTQFSLLFPPLHSKMVKLIPLATLRAEVFAGFSQDPQWREGILALSLLFPS